MLSQTPSAFAQLLDVDHADLTVRLSSSAANRSTPGCCSPWFDRHPESTCRVVNMFGITETTVHVTEQTLTRKLALAATRSVGRALPGWHLYVMDRRGRLLPPGAAGEICVGGAGVALGYLGQEELTGRAVRAGPVHRRHAVPQWRPGTSAPRRPARTPRPDRQPGEDPRFPHRARRDPLRPAGGPRRAHGGRRGPPRRPGRRRHRPYRRLRGAVARAATPARSASGPPASCPSTCSPPRSPPWTRSR